MKNIFKKRFNNILEKLTNQSFDGMYITNLTNIRYLTGFTGSAGILLIIKEQSYFLTDGRYIKQASEQVHNSNITIIEKDYLSEIKNLNVLKNRNKIAFEANNISFTNYNILIKYFDNVNWIPTDSIIENIAAVKDQHEIDSLNTAIEITDLVFTKILKYIKPGVNEKFISAKISYLFKTNGAEGDSYESIIASGPRSALPHARPTDREFQKGDFIVMDFGALYNGYHADMTRTVLIGKPNSKHKEIYDIVLDSQLSGISFAKSGIKCSEVDNACRSVITSSGYGDYFNHSTGHGIGLEVHTLPRVHKSNHDLLQVNNMITIEPGIYLPDWGGVRIEDDCLVRETDCLPLNKSTKDLIFL
tara:strand:+ start:12330 stop:13409 length:1080 start_codon:yes stop_codon:yes gene_type:complete